MSARDRRPTRAGRVASGLAVLLAFTVGASGRADEGGELQASPPPTTDASPAPDTRPFAQEALQAGALFPAWSLHSTRPIAPRLRPNVGLRTAGSYYTIKDGPLLYPNYSPVAPDYLGGAPTNPWSLKVSLAAMGVWGERESSKFEEFRDVRDGVTAGVEAHYRSGDASFNLVGRQLGREDQDLNLDGGVWGKVLFAAVYDETPHRYAFDARTLFAGIGTNRLTIADAIQADLQSSLSNLALGTKLNSYVEGQGVAVDLGLRRQKVGAEATLVATYPLVVKAGVSNESRDGERPWSGSFGFGQFNEIPWPVRYDTRELRVSAEYAKPESRLYASGSYRYSDFLDHYDSLLWDNPVRLTDAPNPALGNALLGPATGLMSMYPSNHYHEFSGIVSARELPLRSTFNAVGSIGLYRQNEALLPFSTNTAVVDTLSSPVKPSFLATDPSGLPRRTAETAMNSQTLHARWAGALSKDLRFVAQYRLYRLVNNEEPFRFFMFVREDQDRRLPETQPGGTYLTVPADYARQTATAELGYDFGGDSRANLQYTYEVLHPDFREIEWAHDRKIKISFDTRRFGWLELKASYERAARDTSDYDFDQYNIVQGNALAHPMVPWLLKFDEAPFGRNEAQVMATAYVTDDLSLSAHAQWVSTDFDQVELALLSRTTTNVTAPMDPANQFGVRWDRRASVGLDLTYAPTPRLNLFADAGFDRWEYEQGGRQWTVNGISDPYLRERIAASNSNWVASPRDRTYTGGLGFDAELIPDRLHLNAQYTYSRSDGRHEYSSPVGVAANDVNAFVPQSFEDVDDIRWHVANAELAWKMKHGFSMAAGYHFEKWEIDDYTYKGFVYAPVYNNGVGLLMGGLLPPGYDANVAYVRVTAGF